MKLQWHLGDVIGKMRERKGLTRAELAKLSGLSAFHMGRIERTGQCRSATLITIARALGVDMATIAANVPQPPATAKSPCPDSNPEHETMHEMLETLLHDADETWGMGIRHYLRTMFDGVNFIREGRGRFHPAAPVRINDMMTVHRGAKNKKLNKTP